jgi:hypothetical protein
MPRSFTASHPVSILGFSLAMLVACAATVRAESIWRCQVDEHAGTRYQSTPCPLSGRALPATPPPSQQNREAADEVAEREARLARDMARQRAHQHKTAPTAHASLSGPVRQVSVGPARSTASQSAHATRARSALAHRPRRDDVFRAEVPGRRRGAAQAEALAASPP